MVPRRDFEKLVEEAVLAIPAKVRKMVGNVDIVIERRPPPGLDEGTEGESGELLGLFEGYSITEQWGDMSGTLPGKITLFQETIEEEAGCVEEISAVVRETVWHEIAHWFGFDEDDAERLETKWHK